MSKAKFSRFEGTRWDKNQIFRIKPLWQIDSDRHHHYSYKIPAWGRTCYYTIVCNFAPRFFPFTSHYEMRKICLIWSMAIWVDKFLSEGFEIIFFFSKNPNNQRKFLYFVNRHSYRNGQKSFKVKDLLLFFLLQRIIISNS